VVDSVSLEDVSSSTNEQNGKTTEEKNTEAKKKTRSSISYPPYINGYGSIPQLFEKIRQAAVPPKFTQDFVSTVLGMKSSGHRALIPLLKKLGFVDQANLPTEAYRLYRDGAHSGNIMARQLRFTYSDLYQAHEYAHQLSKDDLASKLRTLTGASEEDKNISAVVGTFWELKKLADFDEVQENYKPVQEPPKRVESEQTPEPKIHSHKSRQSNLGISYTINLNLPATTDIEVFNAIFKSLREHIFYGD
jgi:Family of unknown function (DUF5343)